MSTVAILDYSGAEELFKGVTKAAKAKTQRFFLVTLLANALVQVPFQCISVAFFGLDFDWISQFAPHVLIGSHNLLITF